MQLQTFIAYRTENHSFPGFGSLTKAVRFVSAFGVPSSKFTADTEAGLKYKKQEAHSNRGKTAIAMRRRRPSG